MTFRRREEYKCDGEGNEGNPCVIKTRPYKGTYNCRYCGRIMEKQFEDDVKDVESFNGKNERTNVTVVSAGQDISQMLLKGGNIDESQSYAFKKDMDLVFNKINPGEGGIDMAMGLYKQYLIRRAEPKRDNTEKIKKMKKDNLIKGIAMIVFEKKGVVVTRKILTDKLGWKFSEVSKLKRNVQQVLDIKNEKVVVDYTSQIREKCNELDIGSIASACIQISDDLFILLDGKQSSSIIACIILFTAKELNQEINEVLLAGKCGTTVDTIKKIFKNSLTEEDKERLRKKLRY